MIRVLFICHGNICRSPMAEFIFKNLVKELRIEDNFIIASAATSMEEIWNGVGNPVYPPARDELAKHGIICEGKRAVQLKESDYEYYDFLIGMDSMNIRNIHRIIGEKSSKVYKLLGFTSNPTDVADPWYTGDFTRTYEDILRGLMGFLSYLREKNYI